MDASIAVAEGALRERAAAVLGKRRAADAMGAEPEDLQIGR